MIVPSGLTPNIVSANFSPLHSVLHLHLTHSALKNIDIGIVIGDIKNFEAVSIQSMKKRFDLAENKDKIINLESRGIIHILR
jgi:hypothetical protein